MANAGTGMGHQRRTDDWPARVGAQTVDVGVVARTEESCVSVQIANVGEQTSMLSL
jgi:hypothetical protein